MGCFKLINYKRDLKKNENKMMCGGKTELILIIQSLEVIPRNAKANIDPTFIEDGPCGTS